MDLPETWQLHRIASDTAENLHLYYYRRESASKWQGDIVVTIYFLKDLETNAKCTVLLYLFRNKEYQHPHCPFSRKCILTIFITSKHFGVKFSFSHGWRQKVYMFVKSWNLHLYSNTKKFMQINLNPHLRIDCEMSLANKQHNHFCDKLHMKEWQVQLKQHSHHTQKQEFQLCV